MMTPPPVALVTGASRGIGRGIALALARSGYSVAINFAANRDAAEECQRLCRAELTAGSGASFEIFQGDISNAGNRRHLLDAVVARFGWIDLLVNNAGVAPTERKDLLEASEESFDRLIAINLRGPYFLTQAVANLWLGGLKDHSDRPHPKVITISSISAYTVSVNRGDYCISKAGLAMMTAALCRAAGRGGNPRLRDSSRHRGDRHDRPGEGEVRPHDCRWADPHCPLGNSGGCRPRRGGDRAGSFPIFDGRSVKR